MPANKPILQPTGTCSCGCGEATYKGATTKKGHGAFSVNAPTRFCACGCGTVIPARFEYTRGHRMKHRAEQVAAGTATPLSAEPKHLCECGCGEEINAGRRWRRGHGPHTMLRGPHEYAPCLCGCGQLVRKDFGYLKGHVLKAAGQVAKAEAATQLNVELTEGKRQLCACGCGEPSVLGRYYKRGHGAYSQPAKPCGCGCGAVVDPPFSFIKGHYQRTPEFKAILRLDSTKQSQAEGLACAHAHGMNGLNDKVARLLATLPVPQDVQREVAINGFIADFAWSEPKVALEVMGCYWHLCPVCNVNWQSRGDGVILAQMRRDQAKRVVLKKNGWKVFYVWEHEVWKGDRLTDLVKHFANLKKSQLAR